MPVWKLETGVWTLEEQRVQCRLESPFVCRWWKNAWVSYVTWGSASALSEGFIQNPGNAFSFSSGSEGMGLNLEEESMVEGESHRSGNLCSMWWLPLLARCINLFLFLLFTPSLSWHIKSLKLKKLPFLDGSFSVCVCWAVGKGRLALFKFVFLDFSWIPGDKLLDSLEVWNSTLYVVFGGWM